MTVHRRIPFDARSEWDRALEGIPHAFAHTWGHCHAIQLTTRAADVSLLLGAGGRAGGVSAGGASVPGSGRHRDALWLQRLRRHGRLSRLPDDWIEFAVSEGYVCGYIGLNPVLRTADLLRARRRL